MAFAPLWRPSKGGESGTRHRVPIGLVAGIASYLERVIYLCGRRPENLQSGKGIQWFRRQNLARNGAGAATLLDIYHLLSTTYVAQGHGNRRRMTKLEAGVEQLVNRAVGGDQRTAQFVLALD